MTLLEGNALQVAREAGLSIRIQINESITPHGKLSAPTQDTNGGKIRKKAGYDV